jgi:hypothetical protein
MAGWSRFSLGRYRRSGCNAGARITTNGAYRVGLDGSLTLAGTAPAAAGLTGAALS